MVNVKKIVRMLRNASKYVSQSNIAEFSKFKHFPKGPPLWKNQKILKSFFFFKNQIPNAPEYLHPFSDNFLLKKGLMAQIGHSIPLCSGLMNPWHMGPCHLPNKKRFIFSLWSCLEHFGALWSTLKTFRELRSPLDHWSILYFGWSTLELSESLWYPLENSGGTAEHFVSLWSPLKHSEALYCSLEHPKDS